VIDALLQMCSALSAVHAEGLVHCVIKPANIMVNVDRNGSVVAKLIDFGLVASAGSQAAEACETFAPGFVGSPLYAPPESALGLMDARSDIYSLGATAYHLLVGRPVFDVVNPVQAVYAHAVQNPISALEVRTDVSPALNEIVMNCLKKDPAERFQSAEELIAALRALTAGTAAETGI
jgi:serine/threonine-protein kinase